MQVHEINELSKASLLGEVNEGAGFYLANMSQDDLAQLRALVTEQFLHVIQCVAPEQVAKYRAAGLAHYHEVYQESDFDHGSVWNKASRVLGPKAVEQVAQLGFYQKLTSCLGDFLVSDEEGFSWPGIYWRLVRPGNSDIGPVHADKWFWDLGHGEMPGEPGEYYRLKIWMSLQSQSGKSGLRVVPHSQKSEQWRYHGENKSGKMKPVLDEKEEDLDLVALPLSPGGFVVFHDKLLHGGMPNLGDTSRVSMEFTMLVKA
ncbi:phytanoyl-CoA dioxygenase family protein [Paraneptunicella aestuarii]|uniref:phytanoyl-CoA dioxygenase family protein n=1 Tax=Paraneptunicella aestuarii TaxID=2831148 RepID=UPI001E4B2E45|nr:phytanoyl-CoA dioxygenase family protein [Paraneptunicella aestuarii]UAA39520.1 phytanoyl-CoA dioxygenase family protein [Paraneptunicella aestuarii]